MIYRQIHVHFILLSHLNRLTHNNNYAWYIIIDNVSQLCVTFNIDNYNIITYGGPQVPPTLMQVQKHLCIFRNINASSEILLQH